MSRKKIIIVVVVISNLLFVWSVFNMFYYKKASFDTSRKPQIPTSEIVKIQNGDGSWSWNGHKYDFYNEYSIDLNKEEILQFCTIINSSRAKYINNIRPTEWLDINLKQKDSTKILITLKQNEEKETFFEIDHNTYENPDLANFIKGHIKKNK